MRCSPALVLAAVTAATACHCDRERAATQDAGRPWVVTADAVDIAPGANASRCDPQGAACQPLRSGDAMGSGTLVRTDRGATALLRLDASTTAALASDSAIVLTTTSGAAAGGHALALASGEVVLERAAAQGSEPLAVNLVDASGSLGPESTIAARSRAADRVVVTVSRGKLELATAAGTTAALRAGESAHLVKGHPPDKRAPWAGEVAAVEVEPSLARAAAPSEPSRATTGEPRGFGSMTARLPGQNEVVGGVRLASHQVRVAVRDGFARTEIEEEFANDTDRVLEGRYVFPLPPDASISRVALWVGSELVEGEVVERKQAASIFKGIVDDTVRPRDPALLEWVSGGHFSLKIFPIPARDRRKVVVAYDQALARSGNDYRYVYPMALGAERATRIDRFSLVLSASDSRGPLGRVLVPNHAATIGAPSDGVVSVRYEASGFVPDRDFAVTLGRDRSEGAELSAYVAEWGERAPAGSDEVRMTAPAAERDGAYFALRVRADLPSAAALPALGRLDRAIAIDTSYSQSRETLAGEIELAVSLVRSMDPDERFVLLACDSACRSYPETGLAPATAESITKAAAWLAGLTPAGASDVAGALGAAADRLEGADGGQLVYLGDGSPSAGPLGAAAIVSRVAERIAARKLDVRLLAAGRSVDELVLGELARRLGGNLERVSQAGEPLARRAKQIAFALRQPVVRKAALALPDGFEQVYPAELPNLRLGEDVLLVGRLTARQTGSVVLTGELGGAPYRLERAVTWTEEAGRNNPLVPRLWASARIDALQASSDEDAPKQIIALSQRHRVMSRLSSFLVLENDAMFAEFGIKRTAGGGGAGRLGRASGLPGSRAADLAAELAGLDLKTIGATGTAGPSDLGPGASQAPPLATGGASSVGRADTVKVPTGSVHATASVSGGSVSNASAVVARLRGRFRTCYQKGLQTDPDLRGNVRLVAKIGPSGEVQGVGGGGSGALSAIVPCLKAVLQGAKFSPPDGGAAVISIPITFVNQGGSSEPPRDRFGPPPPLRWAPGYDEPEVVHQPGTDDWMGKDEAALAKLESALAADPSSRKGHEALVRKLLVTGRFERALSAARRFAELDPDLDRARELLGYAAAVNGDAALAVAAVASAVESNPGDFVAQVRAARAYGTAGDDRRACAHWTAVAELQPTSEVAIFERARCTRKDPAAKAPAQSPGQLEVKLACEASDCPVPVVIAPDGTVCSPWTPSTARVDRTSVAVARLPAGAYRVLLVGGSPGAGGKLTVRAASVVRTFEVDRAKAKTAAITHVAYGGGWQRPPVW